jgi:hypothetical protein
MTANREQVSDQDEDAASLEPYLAAAVVDVFVYVVVVNLFVRSCSGSKFLVLEAVNLVFGARVSLGGFSSVTLLILALLLARAGVRRLLQRP